MFYLNSTFNFGIPLVLVFQLEVYYKVDRDRLLTGLTAQQKGTTDQVNEIKTAQNIEYTIGFLNQHLQQDGLSDPPKSASSKKASISLN